MNLFLPADQHFECTSCGRCCKASWTIAVDAQAEPGIRASQAFQARERAGFVPLVTVEDRLALARALDQSCVFLDEKNMCDLHSELGGTGKPIVCQTFPYLLLQTPEGIYTTLSYACPAALNGEGPPLERARADLENLLGARWSDMPQGTPVGEKVEILRDRWLPWQDYLQLEREILAAFSPEQPVLSLLGVAVHLVLLEPDAPGDFPSQRASASLAAPYNFGGFDRELASMVSCNLIAITEDVTAPEERARVGSLLWNGQPYRSERFQLDLPRFALRAPASDWSRDVIGRYVRNAIFGKRLLLGTLVSRLLAMVCGLSILLFYSEAFEAEEGEQAAFDRAFTLVESELLSHTRSFDGFFVEFEEALRNVRDGLRAA